MVTMLGLVEQVKRTHERRRGDNQRSSAIWGRRHSDCFPTTESHGNFTRALNTLPFCVDDRRKIVIVENCEHQLSPKEFALISLLATDPGRVFSTKDILDALWSDSDDATATDVKQYIHLLRKRIEHNPKKPVWIETVRGFGYRLTTSAVNP